MPSTTATIVLAIAILKLSSIASRIVSSFSAARYQVSEKLWKTATFRPLLNE